MNILPRQLAALVWAMAAGGAWPAEPAAKLIPGKHDFPVSAFPAVRQWLR